MPAAKRYNMMLDIGKWVIDHSLKEIAYINNIHPDQNSVNYIYTINLSGQSLSAPELSSFIIDLIYSYKVTPTQLCFEITETVAIRNQNEALKIIRALRSLGCLFALDDFGSGLGFFAYLKTMPVDFLKIDGSFVRTITSDPLDKALVDTVNHIGHLLNPQTIAEWVEDEQTLELLADMGIDYVQGYHIHEPELAEIFKDQESNK